MKKLDLEDLAPPANDDCGSAITISEGTTAFTTFGATTAMQYGCAGLRR